MSKYVFYISLFFVLSSILYCLGTPKTVQAYSNCTVKVDKSKIPVTGSHDPIRITINSSDIPIGTSIPVVVWGPSRRSGSSTQVDVINTTVSLALAKDFTTDLYLPTFVGLGDSWWSGNFNVSLYDPAGHGVITITDRPLCRDTFSISITVLQPDCKIILITTSGSNIITLDDDIFLRAEEISGTLPFQVYINNDYKKSVLINQLVTGIILDKIGIVGNYTVSIKQGNDLICPPATLTVRKRGGEAEPTPGPKVSSGGQACYTDDGKPVEPSITLATGRPLGVYTALGCVPTEPTNLVQGILRFATGVGGGVALLLMIAGVFQMITSGGNPDNLKKGSEQIQSAAIGLLFIIFSVLLLQIIGVDILQIPGFG